MSATSLHYQPPSAAVTTCQPVEEVPPTPPQRSASLLSPGFARGKTANVDRDLATASEQNKDSFDGGDQVGHKNRQFCTIPVPSY